MLNHQIMGFYQRFRETVIVPEANDADASVLELDELWSFVMKKTNQAWIWIALCRKTRQVVAYAVGDRSEKTCRCLWQSIPSAYRAGHCYTDFWKAYQAVIPEEQHTAAGKETDETAHVERLNNTLRQRLARFVRKTLSFSKSLVMHDACLKLFLHRYNRCRELSASGEPRPGIQDDEHKNDETTLLHGFLLMSRVCSGC